eukprot:scaffold1085_cov407-Prasinococcus_capsulatus_cf.AAC.54
MQKHTGQWMGPPAEAASNTCRKSQQALELVAAATAGPDHSLEELSCPESRSMGQARARADHLLAAEAAPTSRQTDKLASIDSIGRQAPRHHVVRRVKGHPRYRPQGGASFDSEKGVASAPAHAGARTCVQTPGCVAHGQAARHPCA